MHSPTFPGTVYACKYVISGKLKYYSSTFIHYKGFSVKSAKKCIRNSPYLGRGGGMATERRPSRGAPHIYIHLLIGNTSVG